MCRSSGGTASKRNHLGHWDQRKSRHDPNDSLHSLKTLCRIGIAPVPSGAVVRGGPDVPAKGRRPYDAMAKAVATADQAPGAVGVHVYVTGEVVGSTR